MSGRLEPDVPHWLRDIDATLPVTSQYVVHGNIRDRHLLPQPDGSAELIDTLPALLSTLTANGCQVLLAFSEVRGLWVVLPEGRQAQDLARPAALQSAEQVLAGSDAKLDQPLSYDALRKVLARVVGSVEVSCALVFDYTSQAAQPGEPLPADLHRLMQAALAHVHDGVVHSRPGSGRRAALPNPVFWFVDRPADLPPWMVGGSDRIRQVPIPLPDLGVRTKVAERWAPRLPDFDLAGGAKVVERFAGAAEGMTARAMQDSVKLAHDAGIPAERVDDALLAHRVGLLENVWKREDLREKIRTGEPQLSAWVKGQPRAVRHTLDVLVRSTLGLGSAYQKDVGAGPRGVLFFAGPTGVGKTEMAKSITKLLFGHERAYIRFDMSEFSSEHTEARLIGSPPGYVGHGSGGELTNAVRRRPFSVVLFDEIEKAHPRILDKFLQILSDGRLTDGSGATVHFSETVIVFTSNLGVAEALERVRDDPTLDFEETVKSEIRRVFSNPRDAGNPKGLDRPELFGRIGADNIVVFEHLSPETALELADDFLSNVQQRVLDETGSRLAIPAPVRSQILLAAVGDLTLGGRGVGTTLESLFVNPLSRVLINAAGQDEVTVTGFVVTDAGGEVTLA